MRPEQLTDVLDCGNPQESWQLVVHSWRRRAVQSRDIANQSRDIAKQLRGEAEDALLRASEHDAAARDFESLADALADASVTFPKGAEKHPGPPTPSEPHGHSESA